MAKVAKVVAAPGSFPSDSSRFCGGSVMVHPVVKRKTPSELRGEQLKRRITLELVRESPAPLENTDVVNTVTKKPEGPRNTRYVDTRLDEVYPARKPTSRLSMLTRKSIPKENKVSEESVGIKSSFSMLPTPKNVQGLNRTYEPIANTENYVSQRQSTEKGSQNKFCSVAELSLGSDRFAELTSVDMDKALKGLAAREKSGSCSPPSSAGKSGGLKSTSPGNFCSEIDIPGRKVPLDFTLKTALRIVSSSPIDRLYKLLMGGNYNDSYSSHSWIYPQSLLPPSVMSVLSSSIGGVEKDFINKRQLAWEDSLRSLYYMLRKSQCNIFYVCTSQFVVMFTAIEVVGKAKRLCNAYMSQSTRGVRSLLKEHDISFSMPLCCSEVEQISREDLVELSEIEKHNLGQAKRLGSMPNVDNSPKSLLAFKGNDSVHGLYDFLLNYRSLLTMLSGVDVPVLCAPTPFLNAALSSPEVRCKEIKRADVKGFVTKDGESIDGSMGGMCYSIEIKDAYLPPWIICSICSAMASEGRSFEASFISEPSSMGLNAALETMCQESETNETSGDSQQSNETTFGMSEAIVIEKLHSASLKGLKYSNASYVASLSPV